MESTLAQTTTEQPLPKELSAEEMKVARQQRADWYRDQIPLLEPQLQYHKMVAEIESSKATVAESQFKQAQIYLAMKGTQATVPSRGSAAGRKRAKAAGRLAVAD